MNSGDNPNANAGGNPKALDTVAQHLLFIIEIEIHVGPASCFQYRRVYIE